MPIYTMLILLLFIAALIVSYLWCCLYERSAQMEGMCTNFEKEKTCAHWCKDNRCSTHSGNALDRCLERMHGIHSEFQLCSWVLPANFVKDHRHQSGSTGDRPVATPRTPLQSSSNLEIQGLHWTISQGEHNSLTININCKSFQWSIWLHLIMIEFHCLEKTTR